MATIMLRSQAEIGSVVSHMHSMTLPFRLTLQAGGESRTSAQNRLAHKWFGEIADQRGDTSADEVKAECNLAYGRSIMSHDPEWNSAFGYIFDSLSHSAKLKAVRVLDIPFTRRMTVKQLSSYMTQMQRDYTQQGFRLSAPEGGEI